MEIKNSDTVGGSLQISVEVIAKITRLAAQETEGVRAVSCGNSPVRGIFAKVNLQQKPVDVELTEEVAVITVSILVQYGYRIPVVSEALQKNVKAAVQNMQQAQRLTQEACERLSLIYGERADFLVQLAKSLVARNS